MYLTRGVLNDSRYSSILGPEERTLSSCICVWYRMDRIYISFLYNFLIFKWIIPWFDYWSTGKKIEVILYDEREKMISRLRQNWDRICAK